MMMNMMNRRGFTTPAYQAAIYCRLSKDDELQGESASISNQRDMLQQYCDMNGWEVVAVFQDDGFTGLNMDRPDLQRMLKACENKQVNLVITKDLSRLGRNYLQTGHLIEDFFPRHGIRYIAMNDGIDTMRDDNDIAPFRNVLNELYSKDISKKVHASYVLKATQGQFTGCVAPIGYLKDPADKNHLIVDEETAYIVRMIFDLAAAGHGPNYIRRRLEQEQIPCPTWWNRQRGIRNTFTKWERADPENGKYIWDFSVIKDILLNPVYIGAIASQKFNYRFKIGTLSEKKPDEWVVVEGMHEAIVDKETFYRAQEKMKSRQRPRQSGECSLFAGLLKCKECGKSLVIRPVNARNPKSVYTCKTYNAYGKHHCSQHRIEYDDLYGIVRDKIRECARVALSDETAVLDRLGDQDQDKAMAYRLSLESAIAKDEDRFSVLEKMVMKLYEDAIAERISSTNFQIMLDKAQKEQTELQGRIKENKAKLEGCDRSETNIQRWIETMREYTDLTSLDAETLNTLIREIDVHEEVDGPGNRYHTDRKITLEIHFNLMPIPEMIDYKS